MVLKKAEAPEGVAPVASKARNAERAIEGAEGRSAACGQTKAEGLRLIEAVVERGNMRLAYQRVVENKGAPGADGLTVAAFKGSRTRSSRATPIWKRNTSTNPFVTLRCWRRMKP